MRAPAILLGRIHIERGNPTLLQLFLVVTRFLENVATNAYLAALSAARTAAERTAREDAAAVERAAYELAEARVRAKDAKSQAKNVLIAATAEADRIRTGATV